MSIQVWSQVFALTFLSISVLVRASPHPVPQAVTAVISPSSPPPVGCSTSRPGVFGIVAVRLNETRPSLKRRQVHRRVPDLAIRALEGRAGCSVTTTVVVTSTSAGTSSTPAPMIMLPVSQIGDGQIQAPASRLPQIDAIGSPPTSSEPTSTTATSTSNNTSPSTPSSNSANTTTPLRLTACLTPSTLLMTLSSSILLDNLNRTGYIASNYQFQFDGPPQSGSIFTAGWSACGNGSLALGGSTRLWQCRSGGFYNLYDRWWAEQCEEVRLVMLDVVPEGEEVEGRGGLVECDGIWE